MLRVVVTVDDDLSKSVVGLGVLAALSDQVLQEWIQQLHPAQSHSMNLEAVCTSMLSQLKLKCSDTVTVAACIQPKTLFAHAFYKPPFSLWSYPSSQVDMTIMYSYIRMIL